MNTNWCPVWHGSLWRWTQFPPLVLDCVLWCDSFPIRPSSSPALQARIYSGRTTGQSDQSPASVQEFSTTVKQHANPLNASLLFIHISFYPHDYLHAWISLEDAAHIWSTTAVNIWEKMIICFSHFHCFRLKNYDDLDANVKNVQISYTLIWNGIHE